MSTGTEYFLERAGISERQVKYARMGYEAEIRSLAEKLSSCRIDEAEIIIKEINAASNAMKDLEKTHEYNLEAYRGNRLVVGEGGTL